jgi:methionyl-tRNA synthetase
MDRRFYITTPIYYPNGEPHLGHVYTTIAADTIARYHRLAGDDTFFLTGTDEHGVKMVKTAAGRGVTPRELANEFSDEFRNLWKELHVSNDDFIRTPEDRHHATVTVVVKQLLANDDIYMGFYTGWYDEGQEEFITETTAKEQEFKSAVSGRPLVRHEEKSYFFRLSKYVPRILQYIADHPDFIQPDGRRNEVVSKLKAGVDDLSISRASLQWGIPMPNDPQHIVFVWIDALTNYISALGYGTGDDHRFNKFWPADVHLIGKEIIWFHTVYWPAMLMSLGLPLPKKVFAHGWWTHEARKMSKTLGNVVDVPAIRKIISTYSEDAFRYYLLRAATFGADLDWSDKEFANAYFELSKKLGNCLNRLTSMAAKYRHNTIPASGEITDGDRVVLDAVEQLPKKLAGAYERIALQDCVTLPIDLVRLVDGYIEATAPFKLAKDPAQSARLDSVLRVIARGIHAALIGLLPALPDKAAAGLSQLGVDVAGKSMKELFEANLADNMPLGTPSALFPPVETA